MTFTITVEQLFNILLGFCAVASVVLTWGTKRMADGRESYPSFDGSGEYNPNIGFTGTINHAVRWSKSLGSYCGVLGDYGTPSFMLPL
jgi:hypothetical protein